MSRTDGLNASIVKDTCYMYYLTRVFIHVYAGIERPSSVRRLSTFSNDLSSDAVRLILYSKLWQSKGYSAHVYDT